MFLFRCSNYLDKIINGKRATQFEECFYFGRYRDDCFILWCRDTEKLNDFNKMWNILDEKLKFTIESRGNSICFPDLKISIQNNRLETTLYSKPTKSHLYVETSFCHKKSSTCHKKSSLK